MCVIDGQVIEDGTKVERDFKRPAKISKFLAGDCDLEYAGKVTAMSFDPERASFTSFLALNTIKAGNNAVQNVVQSLKGPAAPGGPK